MGKSVRWRMAWPCCTDNALGNLVNRVVSKLTLILVFTGGRTELRMILPLMAEEPFKFMVYILKSGEPV